MVGKAPLYLAALLVLAILLALAACRPVAPAVATESAAPALPQAQAQQVTQLSASERAASTETAQPAAPQPQAAPTPAWYPPPFQPIPTDAEESRRAAQRMPVITPQGGGDDTAGLPPGARRDLSKATVAPIPPPRPTLSAQDADTALSVLLADPAVAPKLLGKKYRVVQNAPAKQVQTIILQDVLRTNPSLSGQALTTARESHPCNTGKSCAGVLVFNYTDNYPIEALVDLEARKVIISRVPPESRWPDPTPEEVELAKAIAIKDAEFIQKIAGRPNHYEFYQGGGGGSIRFVTLIYSVGDRIKPDTRLWVTVNLRDEKVANIIGR